MTHKVEAGAGPLLLCLHGIGGSAQSFRPQLDGLSARLRVLARDAPGYGRSPDPGGYPGTRGYVDDAASLIQAAGVERAYVIGMSWGGVIAMRLALERPELVAGLILGDSTRGSGQSPAQAQAMRDRVSELSEVGAEEFARRRIPRLLAAGASQAAIDQAVSAMAESIRLPGYGYAARFMADSNLAGDLGKIVAPTLILYGELDQVTGETESHALHAGIADSELVEIPSAGHLSNQESPELFNGTVLRFVLEQEADQQ